MSKRVFSFFLRVVLSLFDCNSIRAYKCLVKDCCLDLHKKGDFRIRSLVQNMLTSASEPTVYLVLWLDGVKEFCTYLQKCPKAVFWPLLH